MKTHIRTLFATLAIIIASLFVLPVVVHAADGTGTATTTADMPWQLALIPVLTPIIIALVKRLAPKIPTVAIPILAPILGIVLNLILSWTSGDGGNIWLAMGLGLAGVGVREVLDQIKTAAT